MPCGSLDRGISIQLLQLNGVRLLTITYMPIQGQTHVQTPNKVSAHAKYD